MFKAKISRRDALKAKAAAVAAAAAGISLPAAAQNLVTDSEHTQLKWSKAPCRFCGTGCSVMVATKDQRVVATHGDSLAPVNRGLNCVKGYFLSKIMYGEDRLTHPLLRMKDGKVAFLSNNAGGVLGGISTGQPVVCRVAFKPTSSILTPVDSIDRQGQAAQVRTKGRHDPCVGIRGTPVVEAMMALVLADHRLLHRAQCG